MVAFRSWPRVGAATLLAAVLLGLGAGCKRGSSSSNTVTVQGVLSYTRVPVTYDAATGSPTGLGAALPGQPARGVVVRAFQLYEVQQGATTVPTWRLAGPPVVTDIDGVFKISGEILSGYRTFLEVTSVFQQIGGNAASVKIIADPAGIRSTVAEPERPIYVYRMDLAGNVLTDPTSSPESVAMATDSVTRNIALTTSEVWAVTVPTWYLPGNVSSQANPAAGTAARKPSDTLPLGSRALAILDSIYQFAYYYGDPTPSRVKAGVLDLHYWPGGSTGGAPAITEAPRRSFIDYDPATSPLDARGNPLASDGTRLHYFGSLAAGPVIDDAMDPGVIYPLLARNNLYGQNKTSLFPTGTTSLPSLAPDLAVVDGLGDALAATLLKTPFLTDTTAATALAPRDIRTIPALPGIGSPAALASLAWQVTLQANGIAYGTGTYQDWLKFDPIAAQRLFTLIYPTTAASPASQVAVQYDIASILTQLGRLQEAKTGSESVDLRGIFSDLQLNLLTLPYGITWTGDKAWTPFMADWGLNPDSLVTPLPGFTLSMANAQLVPNPDLDNTDAALASVYPDVSQGAVAYAALRLNLDRSYTLRVTTDQALPAGAAIEVVLVEGLVQTPYRFEAGAVNPSYTITLLGNHLDFVTPVWHYLRIRVLAPTVPAPAIVPDLQVTVHLDKVAA